MMVLGTMMLGAYLAMNDKSGLHGRDPLRLHDVERAGGGSRSSDWRGSLRITRRSMPRSG